VNVTEIANGGTIYGTINGTINGTVVKPSSIKSREKRTSRINCAETDSTYEGTKEGEQYQHIFQSFYTL